MHDKPQKSPLPLVWTHLGAETLCQRAEIHDSLWGLQKQSRQLLLSRGHRRAYAGRAVCGREVAAWQLSRSLAQRIGDVRPPVTSHRARHWGVARKRLGFAGSMENLARGPGHGPTTEVKAIDVPVESRASSCETA